MVKLEQIEANLQNIGNSDSEIREQVFEFWHLNREQRKFNLEQYRYLLEQAIINTNNNQVLIRSYSLLLLDCLLQADSDYNLFDQNDYQNITNALIEYMNFENDFRGYNKKVGFIHTLAHLSDCIYSLSNNKQINIGNIIKVYLKLIDEANCKYQHLEDERIARALANVDSRHQLLVANWLSTRSSYLKAQKLCQSSYLLHVSKYRLIYKALLSYEMYNSILINQLKTFY